MKKLQNRRLSRASNLNLQSFGSLSSPDVSINMHNASIRFVRPHRASTPKNQTPSVFSRSLSLNDVSRERNGLPLNLQLQQQQIATIIDRLDNLAEEEFRINNRLAMVTVDLDNMRLRERNNEFYMQNLERRLRDRNRMQSLDEELGRINQLGPLDLTQEEEREERKEEESEKNKKKEENETQNPRRSQRARNLKYANMNENYMANQNK